MSETQIRGPDSTEHPDRRHSPSRVCLLGLPVDLFLCSAQHADDLVRELWLMSMTHGTARDDHRRLADAAEAVANRGAALRRSTVDQVLAARSAGRETVDLEFRVPLATAEATLEWDRVLDEMDDLCRRGILLSLPSDSDLRAYRRWYVGETVRQLQHGQSPTPYDRWQAEGWSAQPPHNTGA